MDDLTKPIVDDLRNQVEEKGGFYNCLTTSQAPTGSVSNFLRNIDTGIEPFFALSVDRRVRDPKEGWITFTLKPAELEDLFQEDKGFLERAEAQTALKLPPIDQLNMLAAFQRHNHTGVSKTVNLPASVTVEEVKELILTSRDMRLKGFTIYSDSSLEGVLAVSKDDKKEADPPAPGSGEAGGGPAAGENSFSAPSPRAKDTHIAIGAPRKLFGGSSMPRGGPFGGSLEPLCSTKNARHL